MAAQSHFYQTPQSFSRLVSSLFPVPMNKDMEQPLLIRDLVLSVLVAVKKSLSTRFSAGEIQHKRVKSGLQDCSSTSPWCSPPSKPMCLLLLAPIPHSGSSPSCCLELCCVLVAVKSAVVVHKLREGLRDAAPSATFAAGDGWDGQGLSSLMLCV